MTCVGPLSVKKIVQVVAVEAEVEAEAEAEEAAAEAAEAEAEAVEAAEAEAEAAKEGDLSGESKPTAPRFGAFGRTPSPAVASGGGGSCSADQPPEGWAMAPCEDGGFVRIGRDSESVAVTPATSCKESWEAWGEDCVKSDTRGDRAVLELRANHAQEVAALQACARDREGG